MSQTLTLKYIALNFITKIFSKLKYQFIIVDTSVCITIDYQNLFINCLFENKH